MNVPDGRKIFIQFSCEVNKTTKDNLFNRFLLQNIDTKNVSIPKVFHDITENTYKERNNKLKPFFINGLSSLQHVYLNQVESCMYYIVLNVFLTET